MAGGSSRRYPPELRERAVRMVAEVSDQHDSEWAAMGEVARLLGVGTAETVRKWVRQAQVDRRPYTVDGFKLGKWVATQRGSHGKGALDADRQRRLEELPGWTWKASSSPWAKQTDHICFLHALVVVWTLSDLACEW